MSHGMCGREAERKMLLSHLSAPLLVEVMEKGGFSSHFSVHLQLRIRGRQFTVLWRGLMKRRAAMPPTVNVQNVRSGRPRVDFYKLWVSFKVLYAHSCPFFNADE